MGCPEVEFLRNKSRNSLIKDLAEYNQNTDNIIAKGVNSSIRGDVSGFDMNLAKLPGVFTFDASKIGKAVEKKYFSRKQNGDFESITENVALHLRKNSSDYNLLVVEENNGQLGPSDYKCLCMLEQIIYNKITSNPSEFIDIHDDIYFYLGTIQEFAIKTFGYDSGAAYKTIYNFLHRIKKLSFTTIGATGFSLKDNGMGIREEREFRPFTGLLEKGGVEKTRGLNLLVNKSIVLNIINKGVRLQYNDIVNSIKNPCSTFLFRYLTLFDVHNKIIVKYSTLTFLLDIKREKTKMRAVRQIGRIASRINNDKIGNVLLFGNYGDKGLFNMDSPFYVVDMNSKEDWQFFFNFDINVTPEIRTYSSNSMKSLALERQIDIYKNRKEIINEIYEIASSMDMTIVDFFKSGNAAVLLSQIYGMADEEIQKTKRQLTRKKVAETIIGTKAVKAYGSAETALMAINEAEAKRLLDYKASIKQPEAQNIVEEAKVARRGRPKKDTFDDIPF